MWYCRTCKREFEEPEVERESFEMFYGVSHLFPTQNYFDHEICPLCGDDDIEEMRECDYCEEWNLEDDLEDTEGMINGGIGYLCPQCMKDCGIGGE